MALRVADAFVTAPGSIGEELRAQLHEHFAPEQIVELLLDVASWSLQKVQVCLALDAPVDEERLALLHIEDGVRVG